MDGQICVSSYKPKFGRVYQREQEATLRLFDWSTYSQ